MKGISAFLFDLDGTLLDSKKAIVNVIYCLCRKYGVDSTYEKVESQFSSSFRQILQQFDTSRTDEIQADYFKWMLKEEEKVSRLFPAIRESLYFLKHKGNKVALVTNKERLIVENNLDKLKLGEFFDTVVTSCDVQNPKPSAEPLEKALETLQSHKHEAVMVGDSVFDVQAARNAQIPSAVIDWYKNYPLAQVKPNYYFNNISEMMVNLDKFSKVV